MSSEFLGEWRTAAYQDVGWTFLSVNQRRTGMSILRVSGFLPLALGHGNRLRAPATAAADASWRGGSLGWAGAVDFRGLWDRTWVCFDCGTVLSFVYG